MGALLDIDDGIVIKEFTPGSTAKEAGLENGDRIVAVDGADTPDFTRFKLAMLDKRPADRVSITVQRKGFFGGQSRKTFEFALGGEPGSQTTGHPAR
jgi:S1-C subfamily serine protease